METMEVLIVEDEFITAMTVKSMLKRMGAYNPDSAGSGEEALEKAKQRSPRLVIMDINLGEGMDGIETAKRLKEFLATEIVFLTAFSDAGVKERAMQVEPLAYLIKPLESYELKQILDQMPCGRA